MSFKNKFFLIVCFLFIVFISLQFTFAVDNDTVGVEQAGSEAQKVDIYFDASAQNDGNGSKENPYKHLYSIRVVNNSNIHLADGEYVFNSSYSYSDGIYTYSGHTGSSRTIGNYTYYICYSFNCSCWMWNV